MLCRDVDDDGLTGAAAFAQQGNVANQPAVMPQGPPPPGPTATMPPQAVAPTAGHAGMFALPAPILAAHPMGPGPFHLKPAVTSASDRFVNQHIDIH